MRALFIWKPTNCGAAAIPIVTPAMAVPQTIS